MDKIRSGYLDFLRVCSAFYVFIFHVGSVKLGDSTYLSTEQFNRNIGLKYLSAHYFVIIFFVLSGFLITMSANKPNQTFKTFIIARLGRLYSVLLPALVFSYFVTMFLTQSHLVPVNSIENNSNLIRRFVLNITFITQSWSLCSTPPLNTPVWSVNYEFMYYLILSTFLLIRNNNLKYFLLFAIVVVAGPKVIILLPTWLAGSFLYFLSKKIKMGSIKSLILFIVSLFVVIAIILNPQLLPFSKDEGNNELFGINLFFSWNYQSDFIFSGIILLNIYSLFGISRYIAGNAPKRLLDKLYNLIRITGNCTYTLYLFHLPLLFLFASILPYNKANVFHQVSLIILVLTTVYFIARQTEWKVELWRSLVEKIFQLGNRKVKSFQKLIVKMQ